MQITMENDVFTGGALSPAAYKRARKVMGPVPVQEIKPGDLWDAGVVDGHHIVLKVESTMDDGSHVWIDGRKYAYGRTIRAILPTGER